MQTPDFLCDCPSSTPLTQTMNKLKKRSPGSSWMTRSMTMQHATALPNNTASATPAKAETTDHYWVARALKSEALLAAQEVHRKEVRTLGYQQELKRERELASIAKEYKEKHAALERLVSALLIFIFLLVVFIICLATHFVRHSLYPDHKGRPGWRSASHFTVPILSPFTSVVEYESSIIGLRSITAFATITACLVYIAFRYWTSQWRLSSAISPLASISPSASSAADALLSVFLGK